MEIPGYKGNLEWLPERTIFLTRHGSHAYGLATPASDVDVKGVAIAPKAFYLGFFQRFEQAECADPDLVVYELRKFMQLAADCNPSVVEALFTHPDDHLGVTPLGERLLAARDLFLSRKARHTFSGFAMAQLHRLERHRAWVVAPPAAPPRREDLGLDALPEPERTKVAAAHAEAEREWEKFAAWQKSRNPKRAELEARFGYDTKFGAHVVRLLRMCREILTEGVVRVRRPDREELLAIRQGAWPFERLAEWARAEDAAMDALAKASPLPQAPDRKALDALCVSLVEASLA